MRERSGVTDARSAPPQKAAVGKMGGAALTPCTEIIRRYELLRYNLFKEKYEKHV